MAVRYFDWVLSTQMLAGYPHLHLMAAHAMWTGYDAEADFDFGLTIILDGLVRILRERRGGPA